MCVLLVEDEALIREIMAESLQDAGFEVIEAADGSAATRAIRNAVRDFTILVTDFHMPGEINGLEVAMAARAALPAIPVIIASGRPDIMRASWTSQMGFRLLIKPYLPSVLIASVTELTRPRPIALPI